MKGDRFREVLECCVGLTELAADESESIVGGRKIGRLLQCAFVCVSRAGEIFRLFLGLTELEESLSGILFALRLDMAFLRGSGDAERPGEEHARCTRRTAEHARILAPGSEPHA